MDHRVTSRAANRPSRRRDIVRAGIDLFSVQPWDQVTIAAIVEHAGMTATAFYYHFASREQLLEEIVQGFADSWVQLGEQLFAAAGSPADIATAVSSMLDWVAQDGPRATVYFLTSIGASRPIDKIRTDARASLADAVVPAISRTTDQPRSVKLTTDGLAMMVVCEVAARCELSRDEPYRILGPRAFRAEVMEQCSRVIGI